MEVVGSIPISAFFIFLRKKTFSELHPISQWELVKQLLQSSLRAEGKIRYTLLYSKSLAIRKIEILQVLALICAVQNS